MLVSSAQKAQTGVAANRWLCAAANSAQSPACMCPRGSIGTSMWKLKPHGLNPDVSYSLCQAAVMPWKSPERLQIYTGVIGSESGPSRPEFKKALQHVLNFKHLLKTQLDSIGLKHVLKVKPGLQQLPDQSWAPGLKAGFCLELKCKTWCSSHSPGCRSGIAPGKLTDIFYTGVQLVWDENQAWRIKTLPDMSGNQSSNAIFLP